MPAKKKDVNPYNNPVQRQRVAKLAEAYGKNNIPFPSDEYARFYHMPAVTLNHLLEYWEAKARGEQPDQSVPDPYAVYFKSRNGNIDRVTACDMRYHGDPFSH